MGKRITALATWGDRNVILLTTLTAAMLEVYLLQQYHIKHWRIQGGGNPAMPPIVV